MFFFLLFLVNLMVGIALLAIRQELTLGIIFILSGVLFFLVGSLGAVRTTRKAAKATAMSDGGEAKGDRPL